MNERSEVLREVVILVDEADQQMGTMEKMEAHEKGLLHRAFSIFIFDDEGRVMLQQRAEQKYHSASLWTNTCCSHPRPDETLEQAAKRRLQEEMGMQAPLQYRFKFLYKAQLTEGLWEHEIDHVFFGRSEATPTLDPNEAQDWRWIEPKALTSELEQHPTRYTAWLHRCWPMVLLELEKQA